MTGGLARGTARAAARGKSNSVHLLRKKTVEISRLYTTSTRSALAATYDGNGSLKLLAVNRNRFFGDPQAFKILNKKVVPDMIAAASPGSTIRIWVPGCGTGEESYSIAMLFLERISAMGKDIGLQIFATDIDADAIVVARNGYYPSSIQRNVPRALLRRYFKPEGNRFRILPRLREAIVFSTHNLLVNVPFSRLDLISCRNLFTHLPAEAQKTILLLFHFALCDDGILFLGAAERLIRDNAYFEPLSNISRTSRKSTRRVRVGIATAPADETHPSPGSTPAKATRISADASDVARQQLVETYVPGSVLVNDQLKTLRFFGPIHRYLASPNVHIGHDLIACAKTGLRPAIRKALQQAARGGKASVVASHKSRKHGTIAVTVKAAALDVDGHKVFLVSFLNAPEGRANSAVGQQLNEALTALERAVDHRREAEAELETVRAEQWLTNEGFQIVVTDLESTKMELQSLTEQLQSTVAEYQQTAEDFENILSSSGIPTLFLDDTLRVRFLSQTATDVFDLDDTDIGQPLTGLANKFSGSDLLTRSRRVLSNFGTDEHEIKTATGTWYSCRITPYRKKDGQVKGVVVNFFNINALKRAEIALNVEKSRAEAASLAKSRFLAAASHDLRQPLQTLRILQELLLPKAGDEESRELVTSSLSALTAMSGLLNTLLDINQLEAGVIQPKIINFPVHQLLKRLQSEFTFHAHGKGLELRMVPCSLGIRSDPRLLEDMIRNLLSNAVKYTKAGRILFGCRRHANKLCIEVWDTGLGIPEGQQKAIFREFHQLGSFPRDTNRGLGLGLAIVQRLGNLMGHRVRVRSRVGQGSVFSIEVLLAPPDATLAPKTVNATLQTTELRKGNILIIEHELDVRRSYELLLRSAGHRTITAADGEEAIARVADRANRPDLVIADYSLPGESNGVQVAVRLRDALGYNIPTVILTGDISIETLLEISKGRLIQRSKPVPADDLRDLVQSLLSRPVTNRLHSSR